MNQLKKVLLTTFAAMAATAMAQPAIAELNHEYISSKVNSLGITIEVGEDCGNAGKAFGSYSFTDNHLCLRSNLSPQQFDATVLHELVHIVQDCIGDGIRSSSGGSVIDWMTSNDTKKADLVLSNMMQELTARYRPEDIQKHIGSLGRDAWVEVEAYTFESKPDIVLKLLDQCN